jgi:hypothetical protein
VPRLFISYRTSDGRDKATALARDLGARFGDEQVFLDKDDLRAGVLWREEIARTIAGRPVLLLLLTPQLLAATDQAGELRIAHPDDPVRREVAAALAAGAHLVPLLCDGVPAPPAAAALPAPFDRLGDFTWRPLRAYDWQHDVERLIADLIALGVVPADTPATSHASRPAPAAGVARRSWLAGALAVVVLAALAVGWYALSPPSSPPTPGSSAAGLTGDWLATLAPDERVTLALRQSGNDLALGSRPVDISARSDWQDYRRFWRERSASELNAIAYRGQGTTHVAPDGRTVIDVALEIVSSPGEEQIDGGNLRATVNADGSAMDGRLWLNSEQAERPVRLARVLPAK